MKQGHRPSRVEASSPQAETGQVPGRRPLAELTATVIKDREMSESRSAGFRLRSTACAWVLGGLESQERMHQVDGQVQGSWLSTRCRWCHCQWTGN